MTSRHCLAATTASHSSQRPSLRLWIIPWLLQLQLLLLLAMTSASSAQQLCPQLCRCVARHVDCSNASLARIPSPLPPDAESLDLSSNQLAALSTEQLPVMRSVRYLKLDDNTISELFTNAFAKFPALYELQLKSNRISNIQDGAFKGLDQLRILNLQNNRLSRLDKGVLSYLRLDALYLNYNAFQDLSMIHFDDVITSELHLDGNDLSLLQRADLDQLSGSVKHFNLSFNRRSLVIDDQTFNDFNFSSISLTYNGLNDFSFLQHVTTSVLDLTGNDQLDVASLQLFSSLSSVEELYLDNCGISEITAECLRHLTSLRVLHLSRNDIKALPLDVFSNNPSLQEVKLSYNQISSVTSSFLSHTPQLQTIDLRYNKIQTLPESLRASFDALNDVILHGNPFHCNCELRWFRDWLQQSHIQATDAYTCHSPKAEYMIYKRPSEFSCSAPVITFISRDKLVAPGDDVYLSCSAEADPAPVVRFRSPFDAPEYKISPGNNKTNVRTFAAYSVPHIDAGKTGTYTCHAANSVGVTSASVHVTLASGTQPSSSRIADDATTQHSTTSSPPASEADDVTQTFTSDSDTSSVFAQTTEKPKSKLSNFHKIAIACGVGFVIALLVLVMYLTVLYAAKHRHRQRYVLYEKQHVHRLKAESVHAYSYRNKSGSLPGRDRTPNGIAEV